MRGLMFLVLAVGLAGCGDGLDQARADCPAHLVDFDGPRDCAAAGLDLMEHWASLRDNDFNTLAPEGEGDVYFQIDAAAAGSGALDRLRPDPAIYYLRKQYCVPGDRTWAEGTPPVIGWSFTDPSRYDPTAPRAGVFTLKQRDDATMTTESWLCCWAEQRDDGSVPARQLTERVWSEWSLAGKPEPGDNKQADWDCAE